MWREVHCHVIVAHEVHQLDFLHVPRETRRAEPRVRVVGLQLVAVLFADGRELQRPLEHIMTFLLPREGLVGLLGRTGHRGAGALFPPLVVIQVVCQVDGLFLEGADLAVTRSVHDIIVYLHWL